MAGDDTSDSGAKPSPRKKTAGATAAEQRVPAKKTAAKQAGTKQTTAQKTGAQKAGAQKAGAKKAGSGRSGAMPTQTAKADELVVRSDESPWSEAELAEVSHELADDGARLRAEISAATEDLADLLRDAGEGAGDDQADAGSAAFEREHELSLTRNAQEMLAQIERAQRRIEDGTYGVCEGCGNPIGKARLLAFPRATLCVSCKQLEERR